MEFGRWLQHIRLNKLSLTQEQMADMLKVKVGTLRTWEQGKAGPPIYYQYLLNKYLYELYVDYVEGCADKRDSITFDV